MSSLKYALITGATSGIGYELAKLFAKDQFNLIIVARNQDDLNKTAEDLAEKYKVTVLPIAKDLFNPGSTLEIYNEVKSRGITVNVLVNDAGQGEYGEFVNNDLERELAIIQLNINAYVSLTKYFLQDMVNRNEGKILNVGSVAGEMPGPLQAVYHGTKAFVNSWSAAIREELKNTNVSVTVLLPGATDTDFFNKADMTESKIVQENQLGDAATVAKDGYNALLSGDGKIVSGLKNKAQVAMSNLMPDSAVAANMHKQQAPANNDNE